MDEIRKVPPVSRTVIGSVLLITIGPLLQLVNVYHFLLWWPAILKRGQVWRLLTCFGYGGSGLPFVFDLFILGRNMLDLEVNFFYRKTADFTWALIVIGALIIGANKPLGSTVLFRPLLSALNYLWARSNPNAAVSLFGIVTCPAPLLPYAYLGFDLIQGGLPLAIQSATGLLSAHVYWYLTQILPGDQNQQGRRPGLQLLRTPTFLTRLLPPSADPSVTPSQQQDTSSSGRRQLNTGWGGTAFAPRGRDFNDGGSGWATTGTGQSIGGSSSTSSSSGSWTSWIPFFGNGNSSSSATTSSSDAARKEKERQDRLKALERRLQSQRANSIAGRNDAASSSTTTPPVVQGQAGRAAPGATALHQQGQTASLRMRDHTASNAAKKQQDSEEQEPLLDTSSSGGTVAEQRRHEDDQNAHKKSESNSSTQGQQHQWGGSGRRLGE
ncbi:unnamed protein product [Sympodiomycopsis kandeliae]